MNDWFTIDRAEEDTYIISEYQHWEKTHCYLLLGTERSLLIDTGLGVCNIGEVVGSLTDKPVTAVATHVHWDHIGGHRYFPDFYAHPAELAWLTEGFPQPLQEIRDCFAHGCILPKSFNLDKYEIFQGTPTRLLRDGDVIDLGGRKIQVLHTPGHSPGHMCFWERERGSLYTGDLVYKKTLAAYFPTTDLEDYLHSLEKIGSLPVKRVFPGHFGLDVEPDIILRMRDAFRALKAEGRLCYGSGVIDYGDWALRL